ncbi:MAG: zinc-binding dehydrogenase [Aigarchaeota archaeon]|nr:zinc-binding dehydrogenase [Aigarchaeota archaeon]
MKALRLYGKEDLKLEDVEEPRLDAEGAVMEVMATTICATDLKAYTTGARTKVPIILGHEFSGVIVKASKEFKNYLSKRVVVNPDIFCGHCEYCIQGEHVLCDNLFTVGIDVDGSFAEYVKIPPEAFRVGNVQEIPGHLTYEEASLVEPLAACLRGQRKLGIKLGEIVTIIGSGPIGLMHLKLAKFAGARMVIMVDVLEQRIAIAKEMGADYAINPLKTDLEKEILEITEGHYSDAVIVAAASPDAQKNALRIVSKGGRINFFAGLPREKEIVDINTNVIHYKQINILGTSMPTPHDFLTSLRIIASRKLDVKPFITHKFKLSDGIEAFTTALRGEGLKVAITP